MSTSSQADAKADAHKPDIAAAYRLPSSRTRGPAIQGSRQEHARSFVPKAAEGKALEIVFPAARKATASFVGHTAHGPLPMRSKPLDDWPKSCDGDCLHCGQTIEGRPLPASNYKEAGKYWVFGQFCRPCCALGYVLEHWGEAGAARCIVWTREMLANVFGVPRGRAPAPPRFMLAKYGGPLSFAEFYGEDGEQTEYVAMRAPPLASFAMYMECVRGTAQAPAVTEMPTIESLRNLKRPTVREEPLAPRLPTGRAPLLLELLATKFAELKAAEEGAPPPQVPRKRKNAGGRPKKGENPPAHAPAATTDMVTAMNAAASATTAKTATTATATANAMGSESAEAPAPAPAPAHARDIDAAAPELPALASSSESTTRVEDNPPKKRGREKDGTEPKRRPREKEKAAARPALPPGDPSKLGLNQYFMQAPDA